MAETKISKIAAVREALKALGKGAMPAKIQEYVEQKHGLKMSTLHVSNYKTLLRRKKGKRKAKAEVADAVPAAEKKPVTAVSIDDLETVKALVGRVGEKNLKSLVDLVG